MSCHKEEAVSCCKDKGCEQGSGFIVAIVLYILLAIIIIGTRIC